MRFVDVWDIEVEPQELNGQEYWWPVRWMHSGDLRMMNMFVHLPDDIERWEDIADEELAYEADDVVNPEDWFLRDLREKPSDNPPKNGMDSVSRGVVFLKALPMGVFPYCRGAGHEGESAMLCVGKEIWRCPEDNEGAWAGHKQALISEPLISGDNDTRQTAGESQ